MATLHMPPSTQIMPGSHTLPHISYPKPIDESRLPSDASRVAVDWASSFNSLLQAGKANTAAVFLKDSYWRDVLCLSWDFHTFHGPENIDIFHASHPSGWRIKSVEIDSSSSYREPKVAPVDVPGKVKCVQSFITVKTDVGKGRGVVRLLPDQDGTWKCYTLFTVLEELDGYEELNHARRPIGTSHASGDGRKNWKDERVLEENLEGLEPTVLIVGCGQGGLTIAARLKQLGVRSLIVDRIPRVGDNWRNRYHQLVLHDSVW